MTEESEDMETRAFDYLSEGNCHEESGMAHEIQAVVEYKKSLDLYTKAAMYTRGDEMSTDAIERVKAKLASFPMTAFHSLWTKPFFARNPPPFALADYEILSTMLSALEWRKHNGSICMITDKAGEACLRELGLAHIWDAGIDTALEDIDSEIQPLPFWAAGKIYALRHTPAPCVMIDTDFIVWKPVKDKLAAATLAVIHREALNPATYPPQTSFDMESDYTFPSAWDWSVEPCNTAFLYIQDADFKDYYTECSIDFMKHLHKSRNTTAEMVFAEQRILAMCAAEKAVPVTSLLDANGLNNQTMFTHVWGMKARMQALANEREKFCANCVRRIRVDFPEEITVLETIDSVKPYLQEAA